jgi:dipeptidyl aminopeptidase/acylaminoacyl peptidase
MRRRWVGVLGAVIVAAGALAQGTRPDYQRASMVRGIGTGKVFKTNIQPRWFDGNNRFWYRNDLAGGKTEFMLVDAIKGQKAPAFDHARLAAGLSKAIGQDIKPDMLPVEMLDFTTDGHVLMLVRDKVWDCDLSSYGVIEKPGATLHNPSLPRLRSPHPSFRTGEETAVTFVNQTTQKVELFWVSDEGARSRYGAIEPGGRHTQHTYSGHVWVAVGEDKKDLGAWESVDQPGTAIIDDKPAPEERNNLPKMKPPNISPDGSVTAFTREHNVWLRKGSQEIQLTTDGAADDGYGRRFHWSPDGARLVAVKTKAGQEHKVYMVESSPKDQVQPKLHAIDYLKPGDRIALDKPHLFDIAACKEIPVKDDLFPNPWSIDEIRWSKDSRRFTFEYNQRGHEVLRIIAVDAQGAATPIVDEQSKTFIDYEGKHFAKYLDDTSEILWMSERDGWNHLYLYDAGSGKVKNQITKGEWVVRSVGLVDEKARQIWFRLGGYYAGQDPYYIHYARVNFDGTGLTLLTEGNGTHRISYSPDDRFFVDAYSRVDMPPITELRRTSDGKRICELEKADASALYATSWIAPEPFVAKGRDGKTDIYGVIWRPMKMDPNRKYPVIENIYAGPQSSYVPKAWSGAGSDFAELGFIVVQIDGMGTSDRSKAFHDVCWKNLADAGFPDRILWMKAAAAKYPYMDLTRVGVGGESAGGQNALAALLWHPEFYKVGIADSGCHDNRMDKIWWNELWMSWPVGPWYDEQSNVTNAHKLQGKLMLIAGELDTNVDPATTMQVVNALIKAGKDFDLLIVPGAGHSPGGTPYGWRRRADFYLRHLSGADPQSKP